MASATPPAASSCYRADRDATAGRRGSSSGRPRRPGCFDATAPPHGGSEAARDRHRRRPDRQPERRRARDGARAARFYGTFDRRVDAEAALLRPRRATVVVGDIPPLAFAAAARAGVPSVAVGNFTWDWIYGAYDAFERAGAGASHRRTIRDAYATATRALRLPTARRVRPMADCHVGYPVHRAAFDARPGRHAAAARHRRRSSVRARLVRGPRPRPAVSRRSPNRSG